ncbi:MAG: 1-deoxy-D-xylulose-5-phosphate synthase [Arcanobacterium sp.]|nr:1-deoxy-D-xylulose-5-phosphate synthase [Arcanobacterium sp.]
MILENLHEIADLKALPATKLPQLAAEIRKFLIENVSQTGGHLGPNLGVVELSIALHRVFDSPNDKLIFDTGHQAYVHKILTGRKDFSGLRTKDGLSGYPSRAESEHDVVENSHATTALSWADGIARSFQLKQQKNCAVAIIGDGALTGGMAWEALNNIAEDPNRPIVIVLNDNGRSYAPTVGGFVRRLDVARKLDNMRVNRKYEEFLDWGKKQLNNAGKPGKFAYEALHGLKRGVKDVLFDASIFDTLKLKYLGPVDGHDLAALEEAFNMAKNYGGPVVVHAVTEKGRGYKPAEQNDDDRFHAVGRIHPETGLPIEPSRFGWTAIFAEEILKAAQKNEKLLGITAAMLLPVGLGPMRDEFPQRVIDAGIAEQHALTMAAGLAHGGHHPVVALYATFMNRAFDQLLMDIALHQEAVTICLDRSGITGDDGASHNGMWDLSLSAMIPGLKVAVPRDEKRMRQVLQQAFVMTQPNIVRYPKGAVPAEIPAISVEPAGEILFRRSNTHHRPFVFVGAGPLVAEMVSFATQISEDVVVIDPIWQLPVAPELVELCASARGVIVLEDGLVEGGIGASLETALQSRGSFVPVQKLGISKHFIAHNSRAEILHDEGLSEAGVAQAYAKFFTEPTESFLQS